jgi:ABC-2 type transport system permease protein
MHAIGRIARKELLEASRDGRLRWASGALVALLLGSLAVGALRDTEWRHERAAAMRADRRHWEQQGLKNPHSAAHFGVYALPPRDVLNALDPGIEPYVGQALWLEAHWQDFMQNRPAEDRPALQRFGELTVALTLQLLVPLLIVVLLFDSVAGERARGTWRQLRSLGVRPWHLAAGKLLGCLAALALVLAPAFGAAAWLAARAADADPSAPLQRLGMFALGYGLYLLTCAALAVAVSAWAASPRVALLLLLGFWVANGLILPRAASEWAAARHPTPDASAFWEAISNDFERGLDGQDSAARRAEALREGALRRYGVQRLEDLPVSFAGLELQSSEEHGAAIFDHHFRRLWDTYALQEQAGLRAAVLSPLVALRALSTGVARSDFQHRRHFATAAETFRRAFVARLNGELIARGKGLDFDYKVDQAFWRTLPTFEYRAPDVRSTLAAQRLPLAWLSGWACAALAAAFVATGRAGA